MKVIVLVLVVFVGVLLGDGSSSGNCVLIVKPRTKQREIRGFKPEYIATAIGFGKREIAKQDKYEKIMMLLLKNSPQSIPMSWLLPEMRKNPELGRQVVEKILENNEEENPDRSPPVKIFQPGRPYSFFKINE